ncbi:MAG TPA: N-acetylmuramoyl-L-alanine amidase [Chthonomonadaceae bacterium]|nr:N-acetylmuramoyl-L-alanine amidase [Chthonomonadaceae bacterium]
MVPTSVRTRRRRARRRFVMVWLMVAAILLTVAHYLPRSNAQPMTVPPMPLAYAYIPSPNCDDRPSGAVVSCIVLHATVEPTVESTVEHFLNPGSRVSAHFVVGKNGQVVQMVPVERRAWHAGPSTLDGVSHVNDYSVGIEMVNLNDGKDPYPHAQLLAVAGIIRYLRSRYTIPDTRIVSHAQIALPPGRKSDPLNFDFAKIYALARQGAPDLSIPPSSPYQEPGITN